MRAYDAKHSDCYNKFKLCQQRAISPNLMLTKITHYMVVTSSSPVIVVTLHLLYKHLKSLHWTNWLSIHHTNAKSIHKDSEDVIIFDLLVWLLHVKCPCTYSFSSLVVPTHVCPCQILLKLYNFLIRRLFI